MNAGSCVTTLANVTDNLGILFKLSSEVSSKGLIFIFPNVDTALRIFLCKPVANCSEERSFPALKEMHEKLAYGIYQFKMFKAGKNEGAEEGRNSGTRARCGKLGHTKRAKHCGMQTRKTDEYAA
jgi:hypothetical protein